MQLFVIFSSKHYTALPWGEFTGMFAGKIVAPECFRSTNHQPMWLVPHEPVINKSSAFD